MATKVLLCQPDEALATSIVGTLHAERIVTETVTAGHAVLARGSLSDIALVILGLRLPDMHGFDVCRALRRRSDVPLMILTDFGDSLARIVGIELGADCCIQVPFACVELRARVRSLLRRSGAAGAGFPAATILRIGHIELDAIAHVAALEGRRLNLTPKEFDLLHALVINAGRVVPSSELLMQVWGYSQEIRTRTLDVHVGRLRAKIEPDRKAPQYIVTVPAVGYKFAHLAA